MGMAILFWALVLAACAYAVRFGGWEGKWVTVIFILASAATALSEQWFRIRWFETNISVFIVDLATFAGLYLIAARSHRWWPIWMAAFQFNAVAAHVATMINPEFSNLVYKGYAAFWALPCILVMVFGIFRDRMGRYRYDFI